MLLLEYLWQLFQFSDPRFYGLVGTVRRFSLLISFANVG
jgi:hypothetical protein